MQRHVGVDHQVRVGRRAQLARLQVGPCGKRSTSAVLVGATARLRRRTAVLGRRDGRAAVDVVAQVVLFHNLCASARQHTQHPCAVARVHTPSAAGPCSSFSRNCARAAWRAAPPRNALGGRVGGGLGRNLRCVPSVRSRRLLATGVTRRQRARRVYCPRRVYITHIKRLAVSQRKCESVSPAAGCVAQRCTPPPRDSTRCRISMSACPPALPLSALSACLRWQQKQLLSRPQRRSRPLAFACSRSARRLPLRVSAPLAP